MNQHLRFPVVILAIAVGLGGELHIYVPSLGTIAMLDFASYFIALPIIVMNWSSMGKSMRASLTWAFAWTLACMLANAVYFHEFRYWAKCVAVTSSSWAIMASSYLLLRKDARLYLWYLLGAGLGAWISLYYFRNGAFESAAAGGMEYFGQAGASIELLVDKQIYPNVARGILYGFVLPCFIWWRKAPIFVALCAYMVAGFWLLFHGGSRSSFGIFTAAAVVGFFATYAKRSFVKMSKHPGAVVLMAIIGITVAFGAYKYMVKANLLGDSELAKYEQEFGEGGRSVATGRAGFDYAWELVVETMGIGAGAHLRCHSVMANSLACEGVIGFLFWVYFYFQCLWFICRRLPYSGKYSAFIFLMILTACWDVFGSPFGTRHKFFVLMAFIALCKDNADYGREDVFVGIPYQSRRFY